MSEAVIKKLIFFIAPSYAWGTDDYERVYYKLSHHYQQSEIYEARFHPDQLGRCHQVAVMLGDGGTLPRSTWNTIKAARIMRKKVVVVSIGDDGNIDVTLYELYHPKVNDLSDEHHVTFNRRSKPRPSSLRTLRDSARMSRSMRL